MRMESFARFAVSEHASDHVNSRCVLRPSYLTDIVHGVDIPTRTIRFDVSPKQTRYPPFFCKPFGTMRLNHRSRSVSTAATELLRKWQLRNPPAEALLEEARQVRLLAES